MKRSLFCLAALVFALPFLRAVAQEPDPPLFARENLVAWCIVPFDKMNRTPAQRATMLRELGITQLAWDWRDEHLPLMEEEMESLKRERIRLKAVWFWVNGHEGKTMDPANRFILETLKKHDAHTELWLSFNDSFFDGLADEEKFSKAAATVSEIHQAAKSIGCTLHLYNHGSWFGEPENQVKIIETIGAKDIGIVYNFHHARHQVRDFPRNLEIMMPYLSTVNINGMKEGGPMIITVGEGDQEAWMLRELKRSGFKGSIGILSHVDDEDARVVLQRNLEGLKKILRGIGDTKALATY